VGNETHASVQSVPVAEGVGVMLDFLNMIALITRVMKAASGDRDQTAVDNTDDEEFVNFMRSRGIKL
jgi:hypothetical protein